MDAVRDMTGHWSSSAVHFEDFAGREVPHRADDRPLRVRIGREGPAVDVPANVSILEALRAQGWRVASSCESGTCGTCRTKVLEGEPDHRDLVLTDAERRCEMTVCVSRARSDELVLEL
jgi:phthalate 4,5-dioxygenase reductase subunit